MFWLIGIPVFLIVWMVVAIVWFFHNLGNKYRKGHWSDYVLGAPLLVTAHCIGWLYQRFG